MCPPPPISILSVPQADGYTCEEVSHLVEALFEASEYRRDALARIRASSW